MGLLTALAAHPYTQGNALHLSSKEQTGMPVSRRRFLAAASAAAAATTATVLLHPSCQQGAGATPRHLPGTTIAVAGAAPPIAVIALNRLGYGPRKGDITAFNALGAAATTRAYRRMSPSSLTLMRSTTRPAMRRWRRRG